MRSPKILRINPLQPEAGIISLAGEILIRGGIIVAPTETRYGLLGRIDKEATVRKIFDLKRRAVNLPTAIFVKSKNEIFLMGQENRAASRLADRYLPGPLTLLLKNRSTYKEPIVVDDRIGVRYSSSAVIASLLNVTKANLTATSANISGQDEPVEVEEMADIFGLQIDLYLDSGALKALPSTVVDCFGDDYRILRTGDITEDQIIRAIQDN